MDEFDALDDPSKRSPRRPKRAGLAAMRLLLRRLDWLNWPLIWWTGRPATSHPLSATSALNRRLDGRAAGLFAVRMQRPTAAKRAFDDPPVVTDLIPVNQALIASALRRLLESRGFPKLLPKEVGDPHAWERQCKASLGRTRKALDAGSDVKILSGACQVVGASEAGDVRMSRRVAVASDVSAALCDARLMGRGTDAALSGLSGLLELIALLEQTPRGASKDAGEPPTEAPAWEKQPRPIRSLLLTIWSAGTIGPDITVRPWIQALISNWPEGKQPSHLAHTIASVLAELARAAKPEDRLAMENLLDRSIDRLIVRSTRGGPANLKLLAETLLRLIGHGVSTDDLVSLIECLNPWSLTHALSEKRPIESARRLVTELRRLRDDWPDPPPTDWNSKQCGLLIEAVAALGAAVIGPYLRLLNDYGVEPGTAWYGLARLGRHIVPQYGDARNELEPAERADRRQAFVGVLAVLRTHLKRIGKDDPAEAAEVLDALADSVNLGYAAEEANWPTETLPRRVKTLMTGLSRALSKGKWEQRPWRDGPTEPPEVLPLVRLAFGDAERLVALGHGATDTDYQVREQLRIAWPVIVDQTGVADAIAHAICRPAKAKRGLQALGRLGLCVRLVGSPVVTQNLAAFATQKGDTPIERLRRLDPSGQFSGRIAQAIDRPQKLADELAALLARPTLTASAHQRVAKLREQLADQLGLGRWVDRDLARWLPDALADAVLDRLEAIASTLFSQHFEKLLGTPLPKDLTPAAQRNWDNALRLYSGIRKNRKLLRRLLEYEAHGDRDWIRKHPSNAQFLTQLEARGISLSIWLGPYSETIESPAGPFKIDIETDPLHVLQMGNYFQTCLSEGHFNAFATVANAVELNKRVIYVYDARGVVIGRKLVALTSSGQLVGFHTYGGFPGRQNNLRSGTSMREILAAFCRRWSRAMNATIHPHPAGPDSERLNDEKAFRLLADWYNDGPEPFEDPP